MIRSFDGKHRRYSYIVEATTIRPMPDGGEWAAKLVRLHRLADAGPGEDVSVLLHEHWGSTADDAADKAIGEVIQWIDDNG